MRILQAPPTCDIADVERALDDLMTTNQLLSLAVVVDGRPWSSTAFYVFEEGDARLHVMTETRSMHGRAVEDNPAVSLTIFDSHQGWGPGDLRGLQATGTCVRARGDALATAFEVYASRFPGARRYFSSPAPLDEDDSESGIYTIALQQVKLLYERLFGEERHVLVELGSTVSA